MPGEPDETTVLPQFHIIDYVRVYGQEHSGQVLPCHGGRRTAASSISPDKNPHKRGRDGHACTRRRGASGTSSTNGSGDLWRHGQPGHGDDGRAPRSIRAVFVADPDAPVLLSRGKPA